MKNITFIALITVFILSSCSTLNQLNLKPSVLETISALQEILNSSAFRAIKKLSKLNSNDPTQALPSEIKTVLDGLKVLGYGQEIAKISSQISQISGLVLIQSEGIIKESIKEVDFGDAVSIVTGGNDAATQVLKNNMKIVVRRKYAENINTQLDKTDVNKYWPIAAASYNIFAKNKVETSLSNFMADRAVDGIFVAIGHEEKEIRKDYKSLGVDVVNKVFNYYTTGKAKL